MRRKPLLLILALLLAAVAVVGALFGMNAMAQSPSGLSRASVGIAPNPATTPEAVVQVYAARAARWRGTFGVHCWIAVKPTGASEFTVYEVIGWRTLRGSPALAISNREPDGRWFGNVPELLADVRGPEVDDIIRRIDEGARSYPYPDEYRVWPGPNSNTFVAHVLRQVPELKVDMPPTAIGKDYLPTGQMFAETPSGTGYQVSVFGLAGLLVGREEGFEFNLLGLTFGYDFKNPALKLPLIGRVDFSNDLPQVAEQVAEAAERR